MYILITEVSVPLPGIKKLLEEKDKNVSEDRGWNFQNGKQLLQCLTPTKR